MNNTMFGDYVEHIYTIDLTIRQDKTDTVTFDNNMTDIYTLTIRIG